MIVVFPALVKYSKSMGTVFHLRTSVAVLGTSLTQSREEGLIRVTFNGGAHPTPSVQVQLRTLNSSFMPFNQDGEECLKASAGTGHLIEQLNKYSLYIKIHLFKRRGKRRHSGIS